MQNPVPFDVTEPLIVYVPAAENVMRFVFWQIRFAFSVTPEASENAPPAVAVLVPSLKASFRICATVVLTLMAMVEIPFAHRTSAAVNVAVAAVPVGVVAQIAPLMLPLARAK
jgi:hypothetical protein